MCRGKSETRDITNYGQGVTMMNKWFVFGVALAVLQSGCSSISTLKDRSDLASRQNQDGSGTRQVADDSPIGASSMAVIWKENTIKVPGKSSVRGFTGRVYFYDSQDQLAKVDGDLSVYAYDDSDDYGGDVPDREYIFPADKIGEFYTPSELGHSYSVWLPWGPKDGLRKSITLIPLLKTNNGRLIEGAPTRLMLSGRVPPEIAINKTFGPRVAASDSQENIYQHPGFSPNQDRRVETIPIPREIAKKLHGVPENRLPGAHVRLAELDSPQVNPNGELYNRVSIQNSVSEAPGQPFVPQQSYNGRPLQQASQIPQAPPQQYPQPAVYQQQPGQQNFVAPTNGQVDAPVSNFSDKRQFGRPGTIR